MAPNQTWTTLAYLDSMETMNDSMAFDISVLICTFNRSDSLRITLETLAEAEKGDLLMEVVVVDNNSTDSTPEVIESFSDRLNVRYLFEPNQGKGKSDPLNHALAAGGLGRIVAFLDDDMSVEKEWLVGVQSICNRHPDYDLFSGRSYVIWPDKEVPSWAEDQQLLQWAMSVMQSIHEDRVIGRGYWPSGNHFWVRSRVFEDGRKFENLWSEAHFTLKLLEDGYKGVYGPEAAAGHRIQSPLLKKDVMRKRAITCGKSRANSCLPFFESFQRSRYLKQHPIRFRLFTLLNGFRWWMKSVFAGIGPYSDRKFVTEVTALMEMAHNLESFRIAGRILREWNEAGIGQDQD